MDLRFERTVDAPESEGASIRRVFSRSSTTRVRWVLYGLGSPQRERGPSGTSDRCNETSYAQAKRSTRPEDAPTFKVKS